MRRSIVLTVTSALATVAVMVPPSPAVAADELPSNSHEDLVYACPAGEVPPSGFTDTEGSTFESDIDCAAWWTIVQGGPAGVPEDQYGPTLHVRRDQMASFVARAVDATYSSLPAYDGTNGFTDVPADSPHVGSINRLADAGIVTGGAEDAPDGVYQPEMLVTRAQMASFLARAVSFVTGTLDITGDYFDDDESATPHEDNINRVAGAGIVQGRAPGEYVPFDPVRREAMAAFVMRMVDLFAEEGQACCGGYPDSPPSLTSADVADHDADSVLSAGDVITLRFDEPVVLSSSVTLVDEYDESVAIADDGSGVASTWAGVDDGATVEVTLTADPGSLVGGTLTVVSCNGITDTNTGEPARCDTGASFNIPHGDPES